MKTVLSVILVLFLSTYSQSQNKFDFDFTVESEFFNKERKYYVHVPERYYEDEKTEFGVVYILDGQGREYYNNAKSIIDYLVWSYQIMPVIVVGIHSDDRGKEFIPLDRSLPDDDPENIGQSHLLKAHIEKEIFPTISDSFRINQFRALVGHSRGGAFIANTIFSDERDMFDAYIAISPGMYYLNRQMLKDAEKMISENTTFNKFYFCTHGTVGSLERRFKLQVEFIDSLLQAHPNESLVWGKKEFEGTSHWSCVAPSLVYGLVEMNRAYEVDQHLIDIYADNKEKSIKEQIISREAQQKKALGFTFPIGAPSLRYYGNQQSEYEQYDKALELFDLSIETDPNYIRAYLSKAWVHREMDDIPSATQTYNKALQIIEMNEGDFSSEDVERWKNNIQKQLSEMSK